MTETRKEQLLQDICQLIAGTEFENHVFMVGGAVRDELMGLPVKDLDICVDLPDGGIRLALFLVRLQGTYHKGVHPELYPAYGIARFRLKNFADVEIECVQTRKERYVNRDSRNPVTAFAPLSEDCLRRDLTINSLYKNLSTGEIVDITGRGLSDLRQHIIRTPREPFVTFDEDALRELRCIRFAARFGWTIEPETLQGIIDNAQRISIITQDRVTEELSRMLTGPNVDYAVRLLGETGLLAWILPEWMPTFGEKVAWERLLKTVVDCRADLVVRLSAFLLPFGENEALEIMRRLNFPVEMQKRVRILLRHRNDLNRYETEPLTDTVLRRLQYEWGQAAPNILNLLEAVWKHRESSQKDLPVQVAERSRLMQADGTDCFTFVLPINGHDIMTVLGIAPGPHIKMLLDQALALCFNQPKLSREELLSRLASLL